MSQNQNQNQQALEDTFATLRQEADKVTENFTKRSSDIVGFWATKALVPIICKPLYVKLLDSKRFDKTKPSMLLFVELLMPTACRAQNDSDDDNDTDHEDLFVGQPGDLVGIWVKPGMRDIVDCCEVETKMWQDGEKDVDKGNPMKVYRVTTLPGAPKRRIPIVSDTREKSRAASTMFDVMVSGKPRLSKTPVDSDGVPLGADGKPIF
jgi:hypothetical protein